MTRNQSTEHRIILGVDPGTLVLGYGLIDVVGGKANYITLGVLDLKKIEDPYEKMKTIFVSISSLIDEYKPTELAIEAPFFGKNVQSMLKLGRAQGVAISAALMKNLSITEYAPLKIKMAITGNGQASKEQVAGMLKRVLKIPEGDIPPQLDATDGLAAAYCHFLQPRALTTDAKYTSWKDFISKNESRVHR